MGCFSKLAVSVAAAVLNPSSRAEIACSAFCKPRSSFPVSNACDVCCSWFSDADSRGSSTLRNSARYCDIGELSFLDSPDETNWNSGRNSFSTSVLPPSSPSVSVENQLLIQPQTPWLSGFLERLVLRATSDITRSIGESVADNDLSASTASSFVLNDRTLMPLRNFRHWSV